MIMFNVRNSVAGYFKCSSRRSIHKSFRDGRRPNTYVIINKNQKPLVYNDQRLKMHCEYYLMTPQPILEPALPVGWVL